MSLGGPAGWTPTLLRSGFVAAAAIAGCGYPERYPDCRAVRANPVVGGGAQGAA